MELSREDERVAVAGRCMHSRLSKLILLMLVVLCLLLASLPYIPHSVALSGKMVPSVVFHRVQPPGRRRERGREVVAALVRGLAVPRGEE